jgi:hypothetical protein
MKQFILAFCMLPLFSGFLTTSTFQTALDEEKRKRITQEIVNNLVKEDYEAVRKDFHSGLKTNLPVEKISEVWQNLIATNGAFENMTSTTVAQTNGFNQVRIRCQFKNENATVEATFNDDDRVIGLFVKP